MEQLIQTYKGKNILIYDTDGTQGTIIAVHGLTGNHKQLSHYQQALSGKYRFISYDMLGRGNSDQVTQDTSIYKHADDLIDLIETLEVERPILMGYSMGAYVCSLVASKLDYIEGLILLDGAGEADDMSRELVLPSLKRLEKVFPSPEQYVGEVKISYTNLLVDWNKSVEEIVKYDIKKVDEEWMHKSDAALIEKDFESFYTFNHDEVLPEISVPTLLFIAKGKIGDKAPLFQESGYEKTRKKIKRINTQYTDVNHYELVFNKQPQIVQEIEDFLTKQGVK